MINAGDLLELAVDHPSLDDRIFEGKSGEDVNIMPGGFKSNDDDGNHGANLTRINQKNGYPWSMEITILGKAGDLDYLQSWAESGEEASVTASFMDGTIRVGTGTPVGDLQENKQAGTIGFKMAGSGRFEEI